ncbi:MAG TPA: DUF4258 domain-containing protein [Patescibacteria group bacterium]
MNNKYGGVIWTNHALQRMQERGVSQQDAWYTFQHPQSSRYAQKRGAFVYFRTYGNQKIEVAATQNERKEWVIMSVWSRPVYLQAKNKKDGGFLKLLIKQIFGK